VRRYIASDLHNGNEVSDYDRVMAFLNLVEDDADEFLVLGDFEELLWANINTLLTVKPYSYITDKIKQIAQKKPTRIVLGNHDWSLGFFASQVEPAKIVSPFAENGIYYTHGHSEFDWLSFWTGTLVDPIYWGNALPFVLPWMFPLWLATRIWAKSEDTYNWGIALIHERARGYAVEHGYQGVVFGHTHYPVDEIRGGIRLVNCGDMLDSYSFAIVEDGVISLHRFP